MTGKEFMNKVTNSKKDLLQSFLDLLKKQKIPFCVIGGLAVNAYAEPVVSLDLDIVIVSDSIGELVKELKKHYKVKEFVNSINIDAASSDLRIQLQKDPRYQSFIDRAKKKTVLGYTVPVARIEDVLQGKIWAALDETRRGSKRQKDLSDILRLVETNNKLVSLIPASLKKKLF